MSLNLYLVSSQEAATHPCGSVVPWKYFAIIFHSTIFYEEVYDNAPGFQLVLNSLD